MNIRRIWLIMLLIYLILCIPIEMAITSFIKSSPSYGSKFLLSSLNLLDQSFVFILLIIGFLLFYFCSYRKPGTKLLFFAIVWSSTCIPILVYRFLLFCSYYAINNMNSFEGDWNLRAASFLMGLLAFQTLWELGWLYFSIQLRKYNFNLAYEKTYQNPTYKEHLDQLLAINNIDKLKALYSSKVKEFPEIKNVLAYSFKRRKIAIREL